MKEHKPVDIYELLTAKYQIGKHIHDKIAPFMSQVNRKYTIGV